MSFRSNSFKVSSQIARFLKALAATKTSQSGLATLSLILCLAQTTSVGCGSGKSKGGSNEQAGGKSSSEKKSTEKSLIKIDGSSTVYPITEAVAEEFQKGSKTRVTVGVSGTGGGFKKFCAGETELTGASRPIKPSEVELCKKAGIDYIELPVAFDGLAVVVHPSNDWATSMTAAELKKLWEPSAQGKVANWSDVREGWPKEPIHLFGPGVDSGTYDYFTASIVGKEHSSRGDFNSSEDDNVLVQGISSDKYALGFFGYAYFKENKDKLKIVGIDDEKDDNGKGPITPSIESVSDGTYQPLSRPIFMYVSDKARSRTDVKEFVHFYLDKGAELVKEVGYIPFDKATYGLLKSRFENGTKGSLFHGKGSTVGVSITTMLSQK